MEQIPHPSIAMELPTLLNYEGLVNVDCIGFSVPVTLSSKLNDLKNFDLDKENMDSMDRVRMLIHQMLWVKAQKRK
ncbi:hypothetical protein D3C78_1460670 [compost metagenome]